MKTNENFLAREAIFMADEYFNAAIKAINLKFGEGYAKEYPELIVAFMQTAASQYATDGGLDRIAESLEQGFSFVAQALVND